MIRIGCSIRLAFRPYRYVFILSHMRSGSSLLAHIIANHPEFWGAGETHTTYRTANDLPNLVTRTAILRRSFAMKGSYIVDQINHNYGVSDNVLQSVHKAVILFREPNATLKSIMEMQKCSDSAALEYYRSRLPVLAHYAKTLGNKAISLKYEDLILRPDNELRRLTTFFGLDEPFSANYATHKATGRVGDLHGAINTGHIIVTKEHDIALSSGVVSEASAIYREALLDLSNYTTN